MKKIKQIVMTLALVGGFGLCFSSATVGAVDPYQPCNGVSESAVCASKGDSIKVIIGKIVNALLFFTGVASVVMIIIGGIMYTTSSGESAAVTKAKNTVFYSVIGLVVAFLAFAIVNWVLKIFG